MQYSLFMGNRKRRIVQYKIYPQPLTIRERERASTRDAFLVIFRKALPPRVSAVSTGLQQLT